MSKKSAPSDRVILKILSGTQSGAEVSLEPGDYTIGASPDDDICLIDISLKPNHGKLRISPTTIELMGAAGGFTSVNGTSITPDGETWTELEPLEIITAGTTRFALGPVHANWTSLADASAGVSAKATKRTSGTAGQAGLRSRLSQWGGYALVVVVVAIVTTIAVHQWNSSSQTQREGRAATVTALRSAIDALPFGHDIVVREDVDGSIYASGYVETPTDRRAIAAAAERLGLPLRLRVNVLQSMRAEIDTMIASLKVPVTAVLAKDGGLKLDGLILNDDNAQQFVRRLKEDVSGIADIDNHIRTAKTLLVEIEKLAKRAQIESYVLFRQTNQSIEVNGVLPVDKIDAWVGFIQAYSKNFAKDIALRSYVQLQANAGTPDPQAPVPSGVAPTGPAISIGPRDANSTDVVLDIDRIRRGLYDLSDLFVGLKRKSPNPTDPVTTVAQTADAKQQSPSSSPDAAKAVGPTDPSSRQMWQLTGPAADASAQQSVAGTPAAANEPRPVQRETSARDFWQITSPANAGTVNPSVGDPATPAGSTRTASSPASTTNASSPTAAGTPEVAARTGRDSAAITGADIRPAPGQSAAPTADSKGLQNNGPDAATRAGAPSPSAAPGSANSAMATDSPSTGQAGVLAMVGAPETMGARGADAPQPGLALGPTTSSPATASTTPAAIKLEPAPTTPSQFLAAAANRLISRWLSAGSGTSALPAPIQAALDRIAETRASIDPTPDAPDRDVRPKYLPLIATDVPDGTLNREACWAGSRLTTRNLPAAMFWLDVLSVSQSLSLKSFTLDEQRFLLEAAANPQRVRACLADKAQSSQVALTSLYLNEAIRNPDFVRFVVRDLLASDIDIAGISLSGARYFQTRDGNKHREGTAIDISRRIVFIGELAAILRSTDGYLAVPYGGDVNWMLTAN
jgi:type III secretion system YscD/HrpQ family protein